MKSIVTICDAPDANGPAIGVFNVAVVPAAVHVASASVKPVGMKSISSIS